MTTHHTDEKKPADAGTGEVKLLDFDALIFRKCSNGSISISTLGAVYSELPRCCDVAKAALEWLAEFPEKELVIDASLDRSGEQEGIKHILAFMDGMTSSYWWQYKPAVEVNIPGKGRWVFQAEADAADSAGKPLTHF